MNQYGVNTQKVVLAGLLGVILTIAAIMALQVLYYRYLSDAQTTEESGRSSEKLEKSLADQQQKLTEYGIIDTEKGIVAVPIQRAMELVVAELSQPSAEENRHEP